MTTVPPPSTPTPHMPAAPPAATTVMILQPPPAVAALPPGTVLDAMVIPTPPTADASPGKATVTLRTAEGDVTIRLPVQLPYNARVALEVLRNAAPAGPQAAPQVTVRIVTVDGQPAAQVLAQLARQAVDTRGAQTPLPSLQAPQVDAQNPLLRAALLLPGAAWAPAGTQQITALGTFSAVVTQVLPTPQTGEVPATGTLQMPLATPASPLPATQAFLPARASDPSVCETLGREPFS